MLIWARLKQKFERKSEAEAETAQIQMLDFAHKEGENANSAIDRFDAPVSTDKGVAVDDNICRQGAREKILKMEATVEEAHEEILEKAPVVDPVEARDE